MTSSQLPIKKWDISPIKASCISNVANNKNELWKLFWKTTIIIRFNLLHVCPSMNPFVFAVFSYLILVFWGFILCFTHFGGSSLTLSLSRLLPDWSILVFLTMPIYLACNRRLQDIAILMYKVKHGMVPSNFSYSFSVKLSNSHLRHKDFHTTRFNIVHYGKRRCYVMC